MSNTQRETNKCDYRGGQEGGQEMGKVGKSIHSYRYVGKRILEV
jgi:hypothetical protein